MKKQEINWRAGTLRRFESIFSLGAKFCYLNRVKPKDFFHFISEFQSSNSPIVSQYSSPRSFDSVYESLNIDTLRFAKTLKEPVRIVRSLSVAPLIPAFAYLVMSKRPWYIDVQYCQKCIDVGYHANFHQLPWFNKCLIHGIPLRSLGCREHHGLKPNPDLVDKISTLLFGSESNWNFRSDSAWGDCESPRRYRCVTDYMDWIKNLTVQAMGTLSKSTCFCDFSAQEGAAGQQISDFLHCTSFIVPGKASYMSRLVPTRLHATPAIVNYPIIESARLLDTETPSLFSFDEINDLVALRKLGRELWEEKSKWNAQITQITDVMRGGHDECLRHMKRLRSETPYDGVTVGLSTCAAVCPRIALRHIFIGQWQKTLIDSDVLTPYRECKDWVEQHYYVGMNFLKRKIVEAVSKTINIKRDDHYSNGLDYKVNYWRLFSPWLEISDLILDQFAGNSCWELFETEKFRLYEFISSPLEAVHFKKKFYPAIFLKIRDGNSIELHLWSRIPRALPNWRNLDRRPVGHASDVKDWADSIIKSANMSWEETGARAYLCIGSHKLNSGRNDEGV